VAFPLLGHGGMAQGMAGSMAAKVHGHAVLDEGIDIHFLLDVFRYCENWLRNAAENWPMGKISWRYSTIAGVNLKGNRVY